MNDTKIKNLLINLKKHFGNRVKEDEPLNTYTTLKVGGPARLFFQANNTTELITAVLESKKNHVPYFIIGGGSNLLVSDKGFSGFVIKNNSNEITIKKYSKSLINKKVHTSYVEIKVASGVMMNRLVRFSLDRDLSGLEAFLGQPGTVGGAVYNNAHNIKIGEYFGDKITRATIISKNGEIAEVDNSYFKFGYDKSNLQYKDDVVIDVSVKLFHAAHQKIWAKANQTIEHRQKTQPLNVKSAGCTFKNISKADALKNGLPGGLTSAGYLIEAVGLKNHQIGGAKFSEKHANFIVNIDSATASDIEQLIKIAKERVNKRFGIKLQEEIIYLKEK